METNSLQKNKILVRPQISSDEAKNLVFDLYGLKVNKISILNGYDDRNFHILVDCEISNNRFIDKIIDCGYVLKIINSLDSQDESTFEAQTELLLHLSKNNIRCPKLVYTKDQKTFQKIQLPSGKHIVRLFEYISGEILFKVPKITRLFHEVGVLAAEMDNAMQTFDHPAYHKSIQWCLGSAPDVLNYLYAVKDVKRQNFVRKIIEEFSVRVLSIEDKLEKGIIHGDINEQNLIVEQIKNNKLNVKAIIDFGDVHYTCYLYELAIAMTYIIFTSGYVENAGFVLAGYCSARSVPEEEMKLLRICILARFCQSLVLGAHASLEEPSNEYILTTANKGWEILETITKVSEIETYYRWLSIVKPTSKVLLPTDYQ